MASCPAFSVASHNVARAMELMQANTDAADTSQCQTSPAQQIVVDGGTRFRSRDIDKIPPGHGLAANTGVPMLREAGRLASSWSAGPRPDRSKGPGGTLKAFADQAVIAIENVRLFDEVQARTRVSFRIAERQTATSEVLPGCFEAARRA